MSRIPEGGANGSSRGIAIIGLEGSGKTVFLAALAQAMQEHDGYPYLKAAGADAFGTLDYVAGLWDVIQGGEWPPSTNAGTWQTLSWTWHSEDALTHPVWLPDCAGQDIRQIFERGGEDEHQKRLAEAIFASAHVLVLFNLKELIDIHGVPGKNRRRVQIVTAVCAAVGRLMDAGKPFNVLLTQYDAYKELVEQHGGLLPAVKTYSMPLWHELRRCESALLPVSAVETKDIVKDNVAGRYPVLNAQPDASVMDVARAVNARLARRVVTGIVEGDITRPPVQNAKPGASVMGVTRAGNGRFARCTAGDTLKVDLGGGVELELMWCPPGTFMMGSPVTSGWFWWKKHGEAERCGDEVRHCVTLTRGFWLGKYPVTQEQWEAVMGAGTNPSAFKGTKLPVEKVSWEDGRRFLRKVNALAVGGGFRLPSEAEWEYACRAGTETAFCWGDSLDPSMANFDGSYPYGEGEQGTYREKTTRVGQFRPNAWGLYDMHGNVWEWCQDWYGEYPVGEYPVGASWAYPIYPVGAVTDPAGAASGSHRVLRGGSWNNSAGHCRSARRDGNAPSYRNNDLGFRVARSLP